MGSRSSRVFELDKNAVPGQTKDVDPRTSPAWLLCVVQNESVCGMMVQISEAHLSLELSGS